MERKDNETPEEFIKRLLKSEEADRNRRDVERRFYRTYKRLSYFDKKEERQ